MQISTCQPILGLRINCKLITGFKSLTCKLFLGRDRLYYFSPATGGGDGPEMSGSEGLFYLTNLLSSNYYLIFNPSVSSP